MKGCLENKVVRTDSKIAYLTKGPENQNFSDPRWCAGLAQAIGFRELSVTGYGEHL
jgi:hypothetical protein